MASNTLVNARLAEIKVSVVTGGAMIVNIGNVLLAAVAAYGEASASRRAHDGTREDRQRRRLGWTERQLLSLGKIQGWGRIV
jgi:hypothetical protein